MPVELLKIPLITTWEITPRRFKLILIPLSSHIGSCWISFGRATARQAVPGLANIGQQCFITTKDRGNLPKNPEIISERKQDAGL